MGSFAVLTPGKFELITLNVSLLPIEILFANVIDLVELYPLFSIAYLNVRIFLALSASVSVILYLFK